MKKQLLFVCLLVSLDLSFRRWLHYSITNGLILFALLQLYLRIWLKHSYGQKLFWLTTITSSAIMTDYFWFDTLHFLFYELAYGISMTCFLIGSIKKILSD